MKKQVAESNKKKSLRLIRIKRILIGCILLVFGIALLSAVCYSVVTVFGKEENVYIEKIDALTPKDAIIVPGTAVQNGTPTVKLRERLEAAVLLYEKGLAENIIVSGTKKETKVMAQYLLKQGIPSNVLKRDAEGTSTYETLARIADKYKQGAYYFCTQELYTNRAAYLMRRIGIEGQTIGVDTMFYASQTKSEIREYFAATKAVFEPVFRLGKPKQPIDEEDFIELPKLADSQHGKYHVQAQDIETPTDYQVVDKNVKDDYNVKEAISYARKYALENNAEYPLFEQNCTNFVSQCLVAGGIGIQGEISVSDSKRLKVSGDDSAWFSTSALSKKDGRMHYSTSSNFINTDNFLAYFTEKRGYELSVYDNTYDGKLACYQEIASGDVMVLYNKAGEVAHIGLITGIGNMNAYFCANTNSQLDYCVFNISDSLYPKFGIIHMSGKNKY